MSDKNWSHEPVMKNEILQFLISEKTRTIFDGTLGLGGHAAAILTKFKNIEKYFGCDLDEKNIFLAKKNLEKWENKMIFVNLNFSAIKKIIQKNDFSRPIVIFLDLGICSTHVDDAGKGFSFEKNADLKMSFDQKNCAKCTKILNDFSENEIFEILKNFGEEPAARKIARKICEVREIKKIKKTFDLREIIEKNIPQPFLKKTLARIFQALRIAVNDELFHLEKILDDAREILQSGDRVGIISYHSLEDRIVKKNFKKNSQPATVATKFSLHQKISDPIFRLLTKKPLRPQISEIKKNPRARSAKLRIVQKI